MEFLKPPSERKVLKRKSDDDIGRGRSVRDAADDTGIQTLRELYPNYDPTTASGFRALDLAMHEWFNTLNDVNLSKNSCWEIQKTLEKLIDSISKTGYELSKIQKDRKEFHRKLRVHAIDLTGDVRIEEPQYLYDFDKLLCRLDQLRTKCERKARMSLSGEDFSIDEIKAELEGVRRLIPGSSRGS